MRIIDKFLHQNVLPGVTYSGGKSEIKNLENLSAPEWLKTVLLSEYIPGNIVAKFWENIPDKKDLFDEDWIHFNAIFDTTKIRISFPIYNGFCPIANCDNIDPKVWYDDEKMWVTFKTIKFAGSKKVEIRSANFHKEMQGISEVENIETCPICDTVDSNVITSCGHQYCLHCIVLWNNSCPYCRKEKYDLFRIIE
jgi:hypothetical protein